MFSNLILLWVHWIRLVPISTLTRLYATTTWCFQGSIFHDVSSFICQDVSRYQYKVTNIIKVIFPADAMTDTITSTPRPLTSTAWIPVSLKLLWMDWTDVRTGIQLEKNMDRMCSCFISVVVLCTVLFGYTCICTCCYPSSLISELELHMGPWWSLLLSKLKCEDAFLLKRGSLVTEYYMNMSYMVDNDYGKYRDHLTTRFGSLVVERRPLDRRDPGSIPDEFILRYEFYCLVSNVFASLTNGPGFDPHPDGCYIL